MRARRSASKFAPGLWFAIPVEQGGWGLGLLARAGRRSRVGFFYVFSVRASEPEELLERAAALTALDASFTCRVFDTAIRSERWRCIGPVVGWAPSDWPMPPFRISSELHERVQIARYQDDEPGFLSECVECPPEAARDLDQDAIDGWAFVEKRLSRLMTTQDET